MNEKQTHAPTPVKVKIVSPLWRQSLGSGELPLAPATQGSAGADLRAAVAEAVTIAPGGRAKIPTGLAIEICAPGLAGFVFSRSGLGAKHGLTVAQGVGLIDPDYRGEIIVWLLNTSGEPRTVSPGERIAQLVVMPYAAAQFVLADELGDTCRGEGGFGHTGSL
ncbi:MAG: dUTP diphosphatase [Desulfovibrionaceae bacterium]|nr:dUTP diphosphatase [Desulfovibrionaceae bacterium]MBF0512991.1 dUTP diphosphatase [Desulfovibrionaceae bacterium]